MALWVSPVAELIGGGVCVALWVSPVAELIGGGVCVALWVSPVAELIDGGVHGVLNGLRAGAHHATSLVHQ